MELDRFSEGDFAWVNGRDVSNSTNVTGIEATDDVQVEFIAIDEKNCIALVRFLEDDTRKKTLYASPQFISSRLLRKNREDLIPKNRFKVGDIVIVNYWGLARLGTVMSVNSKGKKSKVDVFFSDGCDTRDFFEHQCISYCKL